VQSSITQILCTRLYAFLPEQLTEKVFGLSEFFKVLQTTQELAPSQKTFSLGELIEKDLCEKTSSS